MLQVCRESMQTSPNVDHIPLFHFVTLPENDSRMSTKGYLTCPFKLVWSLKIKGPETIGPF